MGIAARLLEEGEDLVVVPPRQPGHFPRTLEPGREPNEARSQGFHQRFTAG
jgi:hypothetical protein